MVKVERPRFLSFLCILSLIWGVYTLKEAIQGLFFTNADDLENLSYEYSMDGNVEFASFIQRYVEGLIDFKLLQQEHSIWLYTTSFLFSILALIGVYKMYNLKKKGFIWYSGAQLLMLITPFIFFFNNPIGQFFISIQFFFTGLFIFLYAMQLKHMHQ